MTTTAKRTRNAASITLLAVLGVPGAADPAELAARLEYLRRGGCLVGLTNHMVL